MNTGDGDVELLSRAIVSEAQAEVQELKAEAQSKADAVRQKARAEADRERKAILEQAAREAERIRSQAVATAQLKARSNELKHREELLQHAFDAAQKSLASAPQSAGYEEIALQLVREGVAQLKAAEVEIRADKQTLKVLTSAVVEQLGQELGVQLSIGQPLENRVGVVLQTSKGHLRFDNTLETRLGRLQSTLRATVYGILTGETK